MKIILSKNNDPFLNIATEEYLLKNSNENIFYLYINSNSIIIGKHQNTLSQINYAFVKENNIPVVRRLSGGGTVFHDPDNINFCFIANGEKGELVNFEKYIDPIIAFLNTLNIKAEHGGRNDILIEGCKISGNASHVYKSRVMHHGTLLYNSQLKSLTVSLKNDPLKYKDKAVKSVRSKVTNIYDHLENKFTTTEFVNKLYEYISNSKSCSSYTLTDIDYNNIQQLKDKKYITWEWNYGYSPNYEFKKRYKSKENKRFEIKMQVRKGLITEFNIKSNANNKEKLKELSELILNCNHNYTSLKNKIEPVFINWKEIGLIEFLDILF